MKEESFIASVMLHNCYTEFYIYTIPFLVEYASQRQFFYDFLSIISYLILLDNRTLHLNIIYVPE